MSPLPDGPDEEEDLVLWHEVLDEVVAGHTDILCPFCQQGPITVEKGNLTGRMRLHCSRCKKFIEGALPADVE